MPRPVPAVARPALASKVNQEVEAVLATPASDTWDELMSARRRRLQEAYQASATAELQYQRLSEFDAERDPLAATAAAKNDPEGSTVPRGNKSRNGHPSIEFVWDHCWDWRT